MIEPVETMDEMIKRLGDCGGGAQVKAVKKGIDAINKASGMLDPEERATALYWVAAALAGTHMAGVALQQSAERFGEC